MKKDKFARLTLYLFYFAYGLAVTMISPLVAEMSGDFGLTDTQTGLISTLNYVGGIVAIVVVMFISSKFRKGWIFIVASLIFVGTMYIMGTANGYILLLIYMIVLGVGMKILDSVANAILIDRYPDGGAQKTSLLHMSFSTGGFLAPIIIGLLKNGTGIGWRDSYFLFGAVITAFFVLFLCGWRNLGRKDEVRKKDDSGEGKTFLKSSDFWVICVMLFLYCFHQVGITYWTATFFSTKDVPQLIADFSASALWIGIIVARLTASRIKKDIALPWAIWGSLISGTLVIAAVLADNAYFMLVSYFAAGFLTGAMIPMLIAKMNLQFPKYTGLVSTILSLFFVAGSSVTTLIMGGVADALGLQTAMLLGGAPLIVAFILGLFQFRKRAMFGYVPKEKK